jgi:putative alpha-1,2-mannosidase
MAQGRKAAMNLPVATNTIMKLISTTPHLLPAYLYTNEPTFSHFFLFHVVSRPKNHSEKIRAVQVRNTSPSAKKASPCELRAGG